MGGWRTEKIPVRLLPRLISVRMPPLQSRGLEFQTAIAPRSAVMRGYFFRYDRITGAVSEMRVMRSVRMQPVVGFARIKDNMNGSDSHSLEGFELD